MRYHSHGIFFLKKIAQKKKYCHLTKEKGLKGKIGEEKEEKKHIHAPSPLRGRP